MTTESNVKTTAEKVKSFAMGFIGSMFMALGFSYFSEQASYRIPRILLPVYEFLGNIGLAVGLLILGAALLYAAYAKFKNNAGRPTVMFIVLPLFLVFSFIIIKVTENGDKDKQQVSIDKDIKNKEVARPTLDHEKANAYLDQLEILVDKMTKAKDQKNDATFKALEAEYFEQMDQLADIIPQLSKTDKYAEFAHYNAYLAQKIDQMRGIQ
ncbi:hypothetical protein [Sphingobacterium tabacisoli]|uniref:DUF4199 domain-containing protein n=1 Tax=Sphingobacterium tabacisoli TaxID=2044855 RepID=A0ABW5L7E0_9SPHI|nr:hypothetical protein [Sphingobacterium tabacisoli]